jgi:hypothetical protein
MSHKLKLKQIDGAAGGQTFTGPLTVQLPAGKSFGRYTNGQTIQATGLTANEVIQLAIVEALNPTVSLTSPTTVDFNDTSVNVTLNYSATILSGGAFVQTANIDRRRNNTGTWENVLSIGSNLSGQHIDSFTDTAFNTQTINYRYVVTDTAGGTSTATLNFTPVYVAPTISLTVTASSSTSPETSLAREKGNVSSSLSGTITKNSPSVNLTSYVLQYRVNGAGNWIDIGSPTSIGPGTTNFGPITHNDSSLEDSNSISYRVKVIDTYQTYLSSFVTGGDTTVNFYNLIFYGPVSAAPTNSAGIRALGTKVFTTGANPFNLLTGTTQRIFTVAVPSPTTVTNVIDLDANNAPLTGEYKLSQVSVLDAGGNATTYNVYTLTNAIPYTSGGTPAGNHRHQITRS